MLSLYAIVYFRKSVGIYPKHEEIVRSSSFPSNGEDYAIISRHKTDKAVMNNAKRLAKGRPYKIDFYDSFTNLMEDKICMAGYYSTIAETKPKKNVLIEDAKKHLDGQIKKNRQVIKVDGPKCLKCRKEIKPNEMVHWGPKNNPLPCVQAIRFSNGSFAHVDCGVPPDMSDWDNVSEKDALKQKKKVLSTIRKMIRNENSPDMETCFKEYEDEVFESEDKKTSTPETVETRLFDFAQYLSLVFTELRGDGITNK